MSRTRQFALLSRISMKPSLGRRVNKAVSEYANETSCQRDLLFQILIVYTPGHFKDPYECVVMCV